MANNLSTLLEEAEVRVDCAEQVSVLLYFDVTRLIVTVEQLIR